MSDQPVPKSKGQEILDRMDAQSAIVLSSPHKKTTAEERQQATTELISELNAEFPTNVHEMREIGPGRYEITVRER